MTTSVTMTKKCIIALIDRTYLSFDAKIYNDSDDVKMEVVNDEVK